MEKTKYSDNRLAEELDVIVLVNNTLLSRGFPSGTIGTLTYSYTGKRRPFYALLSRADGVRAELPLRLRDFRVLNAENRHDRTLMAEYAATLSTPTCAKCAYSAHTCSNRALSALTTPSASTISLSHL
ncbi:MAG: hypothetical protein J6C79_05220 [Clostridia bacterium]|nr:hypothetical protein [Clostridia bacterium]